MSLRDNYGPGARIICGHGPYADALLALCRRLQAAQVFVNCRHEPQMEAADGATFARLHAAGIKVRAWALQCNSVPALS